MNQSRNYFQKGLRFFELKPLNKRILNISFPVFFAMIGHTAVMVTDTIMVGALSSKNLAAAGMGGMVFWTVLSFLFGASMGVQIITARRFGEKDYSSIGRLFLTSIFWAAISGLVITIIGVLTAPLIIHTLVENEELAFITGRYLSLRFMGLLFYFLITICTAFFDGLGATRIAMFSALFTAIANIFLNWVLIFGNLGMNPLGLYGAAIASTIAGLLGLLVFIFFLFKKNIRPYFSGLTKRLDYAVLKEVIFIGFPPAMENLLMHCAFLMFYKMAGIIGEVSLAATNIVISILSLSFMPGYSFGIAATTILGQAMGAGKIKLAKYSAYRSAFFSALIMSFMGIIFIIFARPITGLFTADPRLIRETVPALIVVSIIQTGDAYHMVLGACLRSAGLVYWVMFVYGIVSFFIMLPFAYLFGIFLHMGTIGLWLSVFIWILVLSLIFILKFKKGDWQDRRV